MKQAHAVGSEIMFYFVDVTDREGFLIPCASMSPYLIYFQGCIGLKSLFCTCILDCFI